MRVHMCTLTGAHTHTHSQDVHTPTTTKKQPRRKEFTFTDSFKRGKSQDEGLRAQEQKAVRKQRDHISAVYRRHTEE